MKQKLGLFLLTITFLIIITQVNLNAKEEPDLPIPQVHPLPLSLTHLQPNSLDNYFAQIKPSTLGYLIWSNFPIKIYFDQSPNPQDTTASNQRFLQWSQAVKQAIADWNRYLPLQEIGNAEQADIAIYRQEPPLTSQKDSQTGELKIPRARNAQTRYQFYLTETVPNILKHRMTIQIKPGLSPATTLATARHELGHALGIWGHSDNPNDTLYLSSTKESPPISLRDVNTLLKIYQQPTRLGWTLP